MSLLDARIYGLMPKDITDCEEIYKGLKKMGRNAGACIQALMVLHCITAR